jgi:TonB family protein
MDSYLYLDGGFRFLGRGAYPFWDAARVRLADPCAKPGEQTGGKLTARIEPEYPQSAREHNIEGNVTARLTIATDGTVSNVEITGGPPELVEAAVKAFQQWRYSPFMNCGKPVEMRSGEHITFSLH